MSPTASCQNNQQDSIIDVLFFFPLHELLWSFFLFLLLPVELRGLVGAMGGMGQGRVLLPWLLKPEVAVEEGEKPPLTRAERRHRAHTYQRAHTAEHFNHDTLAMRSAVKSVARARWGGGRWSQIKTRGECRGKALGKKRLSKSAEGKGRKGKERKKGSSLRRA